MTRKQLESEGIATIETNDWWQYDDAKWVLVLNDDLIEKGFVFKYSKTVHYPDLTIKNLTQVYKEGIIQIYPLGV